MGAMSGDYTRQHAKGTQVTYRQPWGIFVSAVVLCSDGKLRKTTRIATTADTFFSVPCTVRVKGKSVAGYMTFSDEHGLTSTEGQIAMFRAYTYRKNHNLLPAGEYRAAEDDGRNCAKSVCDDDCRSNGCQRP